MNEKWQYGDLYDKLMVIVFGICAGFVAMQMFFLLLVVLSSVL